jgi:hypothetical protein
MQLAFKAFDTRSLGGKRFDVFELLSPTWFLGTGLGSFNDRLRDGALGGGPFDPYHYQVCWSQCMM